MPALRSLTAFVAASGLLVLFGTDLHAQSFTVTGKVISAADSSAIGGASVQIWGTNTGVLTNRAGNFTISLRNASDTLSITFLGYVTKVVDVDGEAVMVDGEPFLNVALTPSVLALERMIIEGYPAPPGMLGATVNCTYTLAPMPGSAYDPNWRNLNPELARLMFPNCAQQSPRYRVIPPTSPTPPTD